MLAQRGDDRLNGGLGSDYLVAGHGDDIVRADDGIADAVVDCGPGTDIALVDPSDAPKGCEHVH